MNRKLLGLLMILGIPASWALPQENMAYPEIDALCFADLEDNDKPLDLNHCGLKENKYKKNGMNQELIDKGYIGYDWLDPEFDGHGFSYYKIFPVSEQDFFVYSLQNGGGTGQFSNLFLAKMQDESHLELKGLMGGDRCNGGISQVEMNQKNQLEISISLTPYDLITLAKNAPTNLQAYDDLAACAICCVGEAHYVLEGEKPKLEYVTVDAFDNDEAPPEQGSMQACMNDLLKQQAEKGSLRLNINELDQFVDVFKNDCQTATSTAPKD